MSEIIQRIAAKAIITNESGEVLILRKSHDNHRHAGNAGKYNLPGGKINIGEQVERGLIREVAEETSLAVETVGTPVHVGEWRPVVGGQQFQIIGIFYAIIKWSGAIKLDSEHDSFLWVGQSVLAQHEILSPEDEALRRYFQRGVQ